MSLQMEHFRQIGDQQLLVEKIVRLRIRESRYWKEHCFALTAEGLVDRAVELNCIGGVSSETNKPTPFLCLLLRMLSIQPSFEIVIALVHSTFKYVQCLGALYLRLVGKAQVIYQELEPLLADYRKICVHRRQDWELTTMDSFIEGLLFQRTCCEIALPHLNSRSSLHLPLRESALREEFDQRKRIKGQE